MRPAAARRSPAAAPAPSLRASAPLPRAPGLESRGRNPATVATRSALRFFFVFEFFFFCGNSTARNPRIRGEMAGLNFAPSRRAGD